MSFSIILNQLFSKFDCIGVFSDVLVVKHLKELYGVYFDNTDTLMIMNSQQIEALGLKS